VGFLHTVYIVYVFLHFSLEQVFLFKICVQRIYTLCAVYCRYQYPDGILLCSQGFYCNLEKMQYFTFLSDEPESGKFCANV
jgi:hypothetical protein